MPNSRVQDQRCLQAGGGGGLRDRQGNMDADGTDLVSPGLHGYPHSVWGGREKESQEEACWQMGIPSLGEDGLAHGAREWPLHHYTFCGNDVNVSISLSFK